MVFENIQTDGFEQIVFCNDSKLGLKAIISIHSRVLGPALGGCRMWNYSSESAALMDVLRLSKGMTYKNSLAGLNWGGGKAVIIGDPKTGKKPGLLERYGEFVDRLNGHYITAKDVGIGADDLRRIKSKTRYTLGIEGDAGSSGDPSPSTALGVYHGMRAVAQFVFKTNQLKGLKIALQGLGSVSKGLLKHLVKEEAIVIGCDVDAQAVQYAIENFGIQTVSPEEIYDVPCDIFSPSALGGSINAKTLPRIRAKAIAGGANNQLETEQDGYEVKRRGITYAPDYAINAGGVINIYYEDLTKMTFNPEKSVEHTSKIYNTIYKILERAEEENLPTHIIADRMAMERIQQAQ